MFNPFVKEDRLFGLVATIVLLLSLAACGGGPAATSTPGNNPIAPPTSNVQAIAVNSGPTGEYVNGVFTNVTVCMPGTTKCQTIGGVLVDTGSVGLRILASALTLALPQQTDSAANPIAECSQLEDGFTWGPIKSADVKLAGELARSAHIQVVGDPALSSVPASCTDTGLPSEDTLQNLGANGILGVGPFLQDCGSVCTSTGSDNPGLYYVCSSAGCNQVAIALAAQVQNPVSMFATDNNGTIIELPLVSSNGATAISGSLVFGIGTQSNNGLGKAAVFTLDSQGNFTTGFSNAGYTGFIDSGSNALFFLDSSTTGIGICNDNSAFYCPDSTRNLTATNQGTNGTTLAVKFSVANADSLFNNNPNFFVFENLAGPSPNSFDWGLPFFFGRNVFTAIEGQNTPGGAGPYVAY